MQKKFLALAVAGALAPAAAMAQSTVEIYGRANVGIDNYRATGASVAGGDFNSRMRVFDSGSRLGFRVNESLGGGLRAFVVLESGVNFDTGNNAGQSGAQNGSTGFLASRDSYAGIGGGWGDVRWGRQSIWWSNGVIAQTGANYINQAVDTVTTGSFGSVAGPVARQANVMSYNSPTIGGFNASLSYSPSGDTGAGGTASGTEGATYTGSGQSKSTIWGLTARYTTGALRAQIDWAKRSNIGFTSGADNTGLKLGVGWAYAPGSQVSFVGERLSNKGITATNGLVTAGLATVGQEAKVNIYLLNWEHMLGQWQLLAQYVWTGKVSGINTNDQTRAKGYTIAAKYFLSKRTGVYVSLNDLRNESNAWADFSGGGYSSAGAGGLAAGNRGADPRIIALGLHHNF